MSLLTTIAGMEGAGAGTANNQTYKEKLDHLAKKVEELQSLKQDIKDMEGLLSAAKAQMQLIENFELPDYMLEIGMQKATLLDGKTIEVKPYYYARIPPVDENNPEQMAQREDALKWLRDNKFGGMIKEAIIINPETDSAQLIIEFLKEVGVSFVQRSGVHFKTLESWLKEQIGQNKDIPLEKFNAFVGRVAKVK